MTTEEEIEKAFRKGLTPLHSQPSHGSPIPARLGMVGSLAGLAVLLSGTFATIQTGTANPVLWLDAANKLGLTILISNVSLLAEPKKLSRLASNFDFSSLNLLSASSPAPLVQRNHR